MTQTSVSDPNGFGLGVIQLMTPPIGTVWFYEGDTNGYRIVYLYFPHQDAVIALGVNSATDLKQDASGKLAIALYQTLRNAGRV